MTTVSRKKIAIIGTGISGLGAAYLLYPHHDITVYEKNDYVGGHSRTVEARTPDGTVPVDTGFIVFNYRNYPYLSRLFHHLNVPVAKSNMSFGVSINHGWLEYGTQRMTDLWAQKRNLLRLSYWKMLFDILKFNREAKAYIAGQPSLSLGECLAQMGMGEWFKRYYLLAMGAAIWSTPLAKMLDYPAASFLRFFENHGLLTVKDQPQWYTVQGGSREYVKRLIAPFADSIRLNSAVKKVERIANGVIVCDVHGREDVYDEVVFACHADQALTMMVNPSDEERAVLGAFQYQPNRAVLHSDTTFMQKRRKAWTSWVYLSDQVKDEAPNISLSYWMNNLQPLPTTSPLMVTLNPAKECAQGSVYNDYSFEHPVFDDAAIENQSRIESIQGKNRWWFCGAYQRYGFHEDGLSSAVNMAKQMGIEPTWMNNSAFSVPE